MYPKTYRTSYSPTTIAIILFFCVVFGYGIFELRGVLLGPDVSIREPAEWTVATSSIIRIRGTARSVTKLALNNRPIYTDERGEFVEELLLPDGYSILELTATDKLQRSVKKELHIYKQ